MLKRSAWITVLPVNAFFQASAQLGPNFLNDKTFNYAAYLEIMAAFFW